MNGTAGADGIRWNNTFFIGAQVDIHLVESEDILRRAVRTHAAAGVNMLVCWITADVDALLDECARCGVYVLLIDNGGVSGASEHWRPVTQDAFRDAVAPYRDNPQVLGIVNWDEPFHEDAYYTMMKERQDWMHLCAPRLLPFINLCPSYGPYTWDNGLFREQCDTLMERVNPDVLSVDYYPFHPDTAPADLETSGLWYDLGYLRRLGLDAGKPLWFYFQGWDFDKNGGLPLSRLRVQMNAGLAYGCRWLCYWTSKNSVADVKGRPAAAHDEVTALNRRVKNVGDFLFDKRPAELVHAGLGADADENRRANAAMFCDDPAASRLFAGLPEAPVILAAFADSRGGAAAVIVNRSLTELAAGSVPLRENRRIAAFDADTGEKKAAREDSRLAFDLEPGGLALYILE